MRIKLTLACAIAMLVGLMAGVPANGHAMAAAPPMASQTFEDIMPLDEFSPAILGIYRKLMEIEDEIRTHSERYGVDYELTRAVCMYESGGNANLTSWAGAKGYFQVMPATFRGLRVDTNIEAGVKYIKEMVDRFEREDYALAAYNGGPGNVGRGRAMRLESLQYVLGVGYYRTMLKLHEPSIRHHASQLQLTTVQEGEDWWAVSRRLGMSLLQLRVHNSYLARRDLRPGQLIAFPPAPRDNLFVADGRDHVLYRARLGDNYFNIAFTLDIDLDALRNENKLWHLQTLPTGMALRVPLWADDDDHEYRQHRVGAGDSLESIAELMESSPWRVMRDNGLMFDERLDVGMLLRVREVPKRPTFVLHRVAGGENLSVIARRYGTSVASIQDANGMGGRTTIRIGEQLRIPSIAE